MRSLWELTRGIAKIVDTMIGRVTKLERDVSSQERRVSGLEEMSAPLHSLEVSELKRREREDARQGALSDNELRDELTTQYGTTKWAKDLIKSIIFGRRKKDEHHQ